jgi:hypothetical protein
VGKGDSDGGSVDVDFGDCAFNASYTLNPIRANQSRR